MNNTKITFSNVILVFGILFFYLPILVLIFYSFNQSQLVTVWGGFSFKWYLSILDNRQLLQALQHSLQIAFFSSITSLFLATLSSLALTRLGYFKSRSFFASIINAPLVMPEVIIGLSLLLLFVVLYKYFGFPEKGVITIWIAHATLATSYATVVISSRLQELDKSIEEASLDLGATPLKTFFVIVLPSIFPSLGAAFMLSFSISLDDLVLASFVTGPGSTTLPIEIFSAIRLGVKPDVNAIASIILLVISLFTFVVWFFMRKRLDHD